MTTTTKPTPKSVLSCGRTRTFDNSITLVAAANDCNPLEVNDYITQCTYTSATFLVHHRAVQNITEYGHTAGQVEVMAVYTARRPGHDWSSTQLIVSFYTCHTLNPRHVETACGNESTNNT